MTGACLLLAALLWVSAVSAFRALPQSRMALRPLSAEKICHKDLVNDLYESNQRGLTKAAIDEVLNSLYDTIRKRTMEMNQIVRLKGVGSFRNRVSEKRTCRSPATGEPVDVPKKLHLRFHPIKSITKVLDH